MTTFYDKWLGLWDEAEAERKSSRLGIHEEELEWVETVQDHRAALLIAPETNFRTWGSETMLAEIPPQGRTGSHKRGEESIFIVNGTGFSVIDGRRYDWKKDSALVIPFGSVRQHFNTGPDNVRYLAFLSVHLEHLAGLHRSVQFEEKGFFTEAPDVPTIEDGMGPDGYRVVLHREQARVKKGEGPGGLPKMEGDMPAFDKDNPIVLGDFSGKDKMLPAGMHKSQTLGYMRIGKDLNNFKVYSQEISGLLTDPPHEYGGTHAHMEAHLYILKGTGYTLVDGVKVPWKAGTALHIPGPQSVHQHVNEGDEPSEMVRIAPGLRYFFENVAKPEFPYLYISPRQAVAEMLAAPDASPQA